MKKLISILLMCAFTLSAGLSFGQNDPPDVKKTNIVQEQVNDVNLTDAIVYQFQTSDHFDYDSDQALDFRTSISQVSTKFELAVKKELPPNVRQSVITLYGKGYFNYASKKVSRIYLRKCSIRQCLC